MTGTKYLLRMSDSIVTIVCPISFIAVAFLSPSSQYLKTVVFVLRYCRLHFAKPGSFETTGTIRKNTIAGLTAAALL